MEDHDPPSKQAILAYVGLTVANSSAWVHSWIVNNVSLGAITAFCTIALPGIISGIVLIIQRLKPVIIDLIKDMDAAKSATLSGQMAQLNRNLEDSKQLEGESRKLVEIVKDQSRLLQEVNDIAEQRIVSQQVTITKQEATITKLSASLEDIQRHLAKQDVAIETVRKDVNSTQAAQLAASRDDFTIPPGIRP